MTAFLVPPEPVVLEGLGLVLRSFRDDDVPAVMRAFVDPEIARWNSGSKGGDPAVEALAWIRHRADWSSGDHASWAIGDQEQRLLGSVSLFNVSTEQLDGEVGYWVAPEARRQGVAARAVSVLASFAYESVGLHRMVLFHACVNVASCRVAERAGFRLEGTLRQSHRYGDGVFHDEHIHARLAADPPPD